MLTYVGINLFESRAQTLVNTVNCVGVMGKGIAAEFKRRYPSMYKEYKDICAEKALQPGKLWLWQGSDHWVLNFPTKNHWRNPSKIEWIEMGLNKFVSQYEKRGIREISFPRLGCGNGGLDWDEVKPLMEKYLSKLPIRVYIHDNSVDMGLPEHLEKQNIQSNLQTFDDFFNSLSNALNTSSPDLFAKPTTESFRASIEPGRTLRICSHELTTSVSEDDLHGIWISLLNGLVTRDKLSWSAGPAADDLMSILLRMPGVEPVRVLGKTHDGNSEPALQFRLTNSSTAAG